MSADIAEFIRRNYIRIGTDIKIAYRDGKFYNIGTDKIESGIESKENSDIIYDEEAGLCGTAEQLKLVRKSFRREFFSRLRRRPKSCDHEHFVDELISAVYHKNEDYIDRSKVILKIKDVFENFDTSKISDYDDFYEIIGQLSMDILRLFIPHNILVSIDEHDIIEDFSELIQDYWTILKPGTTFPTFDE